MKSAKEYLPDTRPPIAVRNRVRNRDTTNFTGGLSEPILILILGIFAVASPLPGQLQLAQLSTECPLVMVDDSMPKEASAAIAELRSEVNRLSVQVERVYQHLLSPRGLPPEAIVSRFNSLVAEWKSTRGHAGTQMRLVMHRPYQQIIAMGPPVVPLLLREMQQNPSHWTWALRMITGTDPVTDEQKGKLGEMAKAWVQWGIDQGYSW